jgi:hypothetical protein
MQQILRSGARWQVRITKPGCGNWLTLVRSPTANKRHDCFRQSLDDVSGHSQPGVQIPGRFATR